MNFLNPLFLIGGLTAAVPVLLHLIRREHARKIEFPTLMFLRRISKRTIRYQKLRHLLLLLLRVLSLILIALAFTRPYLESNQKPAAIGRAAAAHIILLDNSMSMGYQDRWQRAKSAAADIVRGSGQGDKFAVLEFSDRTNALIELTSNSAEAQSSIGAAQLTDQSTRYGQALRAAEKFILDSGTARRVIHLITDFQKSGWTSEKQDFRLSAGIELQPVDVGSDNYSNLTIRDVRIAETGLGGSMTIKASPVNFGARDRKNVQISLFLDGKKITDKRIDLPGGASQGIEFPAPGMIAGVHPVFLEIEDPELTRDNRFFMTLENRARTPVLAVESPEAGKHRSFFLSNALNIDALSPYKLSVVSPPNLQISGELLVWNNAWGGDSALQKKLQDFVKSGGGLIVILADSSRYADFNRSFGSWLPIKASEAAPRKAGFRSGDDYILMTDVRMDHPIFRPFSEPHSGNFSSARFYRHAKLTIESGAEAPARFENGDPALITMNVGKGRVLIFASSADDESNDLYLKAVYAPLWQQMLRYLENFREKRRWLDVGDTVSPKRLLTEAALLQSKVDFKLNEAVVALDPDKKRLSIAPGSDAVEIEKTGFYEIRATNLNSLIAANIQPRESDLAHGNAEEMTASWRSDKPANFLQDSRIAPEEQDRRQRIWSLLLIAAVLFLLSELFLSNLRLTKDDLRLRPQTSPQSSIADRKS
jgi:uncharacterized membrane protein